MGKYLTFRVAGREFAMDAARVRGILPMHELVWLETAPAWLRGVATMGGRDVPVVDLRSKLGLADASGGRTPCIVVVEVRTNGGQRLAGFIADGISDVVGLRKRDLRNSVARTKGRPRRVLDPDQILTEAELQYVLALNP